MSTVKTYMNDSEGADLAPSRTQLLFRAWLDHGPGSSEEIAMFVGPTKCGEFDALWIKSDWATSKQAVSWIPRKQLTGATLWQTLLDACWSGERDANNSDRPNYDDIISDNRAIATKKQLEQIAARIWPDN
jgi:hypothetical protein